MTMLRTPTADSRIAAAWHVRLLGGIEIDDGAGHRIERLSSRPVAALLARLALWPERMHAREELVELLWPGVEATIGRNRLRQVLSTLKSLLEPPGQGAVLKADRMGLRIVPGALSCDAREFESLLRAKHGERALALYRGELMPGHYDDWVQDERSRLNALHEAALAEVDRAPGSPAPLTRVLPSFDPLPQAPALPGARIPSYVTRLFGADRQVARLRDLVLAQRLVTLLGPGGNGKTRLAVELALVLRGQAASSDGPQEKRFDLVAFVPLASCTEASQMLGALCVGLRVPSPGDGSIDRLVAALADLNVLLVLDNFEQLVEAGAPIVAQLLARLPSLHVLATSRRALAISGEQEFVLAPLDLPAPQAELKDAAACPAVALFVDRARAVRADFHLGPRNLPSIVALVRALEGMPLALELAASRIRSLSAPQMVQMLASGPASLDLLTHRSARADLRSRHASMRRVIEWSWRQLGPTLQQALAQLSVFDHSFTTEGAAAVLATGPTETALKLDELADHSMIRTLPDDGADPRFRLDVPLREFAAEALPAADALQCRERLRNWITGWAARQDAEGNFAAIQAELPNVHAALRSARADGVPAKTVQLAMALRRYWDTDAMPPDSLNALEAALKALDDRDAASGLRSGAHDLLAYLRFAAGDADAAAAHAQAALASAGDDPSRRARATIRQAWVQLASHRDGVMQRAPLLDALALARSIGDLESQARALHQLAIIDADILAQPGRAEAMLAEAQALWEQLGDRSKALARLRNRAQCWQIGGRRALALATYRDCERAAHEHGDWIGVLDSALSQGSVLAEMRQWWDAAEATSRCIAICWQHHHVHGLGYSLRNQARLLARLRRPEAAAQVMAFAEQFWATRFGPLRPADLRHTRRVRALVEAQLGQARCETLWVEGRALNLARAVVLGRDGHRL